MIHSNLATFDHINEPSRRSDEHMTSTSQVLHLGADVSATVDNTRSHVRSVRKLHTRRKSTTTLTFSGQHHMNA